MDSQSTTSSASASTTRPPNSSDSTQPIMPPEEETPKPSSSISFQARAKAVQAAHRFTTTTRDDFHWHDAPNSPTSPRKSKTLTHDTTFANGNSLTPQTSGKSGKASYRWLSQTGKEPGVDVRRDGKQFEGMDKPTRCTVIDYSSDGEGSRVDIPGSQFSTWLNGPDGARPELPVDPKTGAPWKSVRWINIDGMNFETIKTLALKYSLHPLSIEDTLRAPLNPRSKLDFYASHIYCQVLVQHIRVRDQEELEKAAEEGLPGRGRRVRDWLGGKKGKGVREGGLPEGVEGVFEPVSMPSVGGEGDNNQMKSAHRLIIDHLSAKYMVPLRKSVMSIFMMRDGTIITISADPCSGILTPIYNRLADDEGILRRTCDVSMLLEALLDVVVDIAIEISKAFEGEILKMEAGCLVSPQWEYIRHLHVISSQLSRLKRTLHPLLHVLYTLRDQDTQRAAASAMYTHSNLSGSETPGMSHEEGGVGEGHVRGHGFGGAGYGPGGLGRSVSAQAGLGGLGGGMVPFNVGASKGYVSTTTKIYLSDVIDHLESVLTLVEQFVGTCDHLTDYIFNSLSFLTNASMERLSLVTVIFLPLTFLAGYFGMNFVDFPDISGTVNYFWKIAGPLSVGFFLIFCWSYLVEGWKRTERYFGKRKREEMVRERRAMGKRD